MLLFDPAQEAADLADRVVPLLDGEERVCHECGCVPQNLHALDKTFGGGKL
ncbi:hypothetical protein VT03_31335 [Planctomyces sp. SH-PL14]|nr:hypothetical protein VT03_31335 [Planctomyces sp. SH-PL14]